jgi:AcrR family transcriptional regulator
VTNVQATERAEAHSLARILETSCGLFAVQGYHGTSMKDIARALGLRAPSLYNYVESKQQILHSIMVIAMNRALTALDEAVSPDDDITSQLRSATESLVLDFLRNPDEVTVCNTEIRSLEEPGRTEIIGMRDEYGKRVRDIILKGVESGAFDTKEPHLASYVILDLGQSAKAWFRPQGPLSDTEVAREYGRLALNIVGAGGS